MTVSPRRADTRRNHDRILAVAAQSLSRSADLSFNALAKEAGVGVGTVYRHFPTPEALILAVYDREVHHLVEVVPDLLKSLPPEQAFRTWVTDHLTQYMMTKRGLADALRLSRPSGSGELPRHAYEQLVAAVDRLLQANIATGAVRPDLTTATLLRGLGGLLYLRPDDDWKRQAGELVDLLWRGMRADD
ncbi:TetR/AcrR family transcriptional regulator [Amycolatopsis sp. FDAARGOS 1241]|uniref:TetR/AcrR family transcriptional regulator n=1 Tax=Amycolatopsis sp. FDAARGOS 1241 TaxID=2778070 RepID=UPI00194E7442|nr:TetR/AcrR family transcriptional regulator [Amycolatopsis sp. FDAARGOS 1241]QRP50061.1 TetR/AcrR family transcriptional regulator [Amycolatopsis sp. FDAARGOS 1241]